MQIQHVSRLKSRTAELRWLEVSPERQTLESQLRHWLKLAPPEQKWQTQLWERDLKDLANKSLLSLRETVLHCLDEMEQTGATRQSPGPAGVRLGLLLDLYHALNRQLELAHPPVKDPHPAEHRC